MNIYEGKLGRLIKSELSAYFDASIPNWLKTKRSLKEEVKRQFIVGMKEKLEKQIKEEEDRILYGDPDGIKPTGLLSLEEDTQWQEKKEVKIKLKK